MEKKQSKKLLIRFNRFLIDYLDRQSGNWFFALIIVILGGISFFIFTYEAISILLTTLALILTLTGILFSASRSAPDNSDDKLVFYFYGRKFLILIIILISVTILTYVMQKLKLRSSNEVFNTFKGYLVSSTINEKKDIYEFTWIGYVVFICSILGQFVYMFISGYTFFKIAVLLKDLYFYLRKLTKFSADEMMKYRDNRQYRFLFRILIR